MVSLRPVASLLACILLPAVLASPTCLSYTGNATADSLAVSSTVVVAADFVPERIGVRLTLSHPALHNVIISLTHINSTAVLKSTQPASDSAQRLLQATWFSNATASQPLRLLSGDSLAPEEPLEPLAANGATGLWTLSAVDVADGANRRLLNLSDWTLFLCAEDVQSTLAFATEPTVQAQSGKSLLRLPVLNKQPAAAAAPPLVPAPAVIISGPVISGPVISGPTGPSVPGPKVTPAPPVGLKHPLLALVHRLPIVGPLAAFAHQRLFSAGAIKAWLLGYSLSLAVGTAIEHHDELIAKLEALQDRGVPTELLIDVLDAARAARLHVIGTARDAFQGRVPSNTTVLAFQRFANLLA